MNINCPAPSLREVGLKILWCFLLATRLTHATRVCVRWLLSTRQLWKVLIKYTQENKEGIFFHQTWVTFEKLY